MQPTKTPANFKNDLKNKGQKGEAKFKEVFPLALLNSPNLCNDFYLLTDNNLAEGIELKTDYYSTPRNFFFERYSSLESLSPGGPWQSLQKPNPNTWFIYYFVNVGVNGTFYIFKTSELVAFLDNEIAKHQPKHVANNNNGRSYTTQGYAIPISACTHLCYRVDVDNLDHIRATTGLSFAKQEGE